MSKRVSLIVAAVVVLAVIGGAVFAFRTRIKDTVSEATKPELPVAQPYVPTAPEPTPTTKPEPKPAPKPEPVPTPENTAIAVQANLAVPFASQAPFLKWDAFDEEACEETNVIMAAAYFSGEKSLSPTTVQERQHAAVDWEDKTFGYNRDTTAEETARLAREHFGVKAKVVAIISMDDVMREVASGHVVILPAAGRLLGNPYFSGAGPLYHMVLVKGYLSTGKIIANDSGTRRGADYLYDPDVLFNAVHDWNGGDVEHGQKLMIVVSK